MSKLLCFSILVLFSAHLSACSSINLATTLECHRRYFTYKATQTDESGRECWDDVTVVSCWGRCDSAEVADWRFPYKKSYHRVCIHDQKKLRTTFLQHCEPGVDPSLRIYRYYEAVTCSCQTCESDTTSCEPYRTDVRYTKRGVENS